MSSDILTFPIRGRKLSVNVEVRERVAAKRTEFQNIEVIDTEALGRMLLLDGHVQLAGLDEHAYHEALVQIPLLSLPEAKSALVVGGGDGGVLRELLKHRTLDRIHMVEIDEGVIEMSREHLPSVHLGAFDDPRATIFIEDAFAFLKRVSEPYDLIVMDVTDVYEGEDGALSERLFTDEFHRDCLAALSAKGMLVTQADNLIFCPYSLDAILDTFGTIFPRHGAYQALVPSFGGFSGFAWASTGAEVLTRWPGAPVALRYLNEATWMLAMRELSFGPRLKR